MWYQNILETIGQTPMVKLNKIANSDHSTNQQDNWIPYTPRCIRLTLRIRLRACDTVRVCARYDRVVCVRERRVLVAFRV